MRREDSRHLFRWPFHPANTPLQHLFTTTGMLDIKQIAVSRLVLDNFAHIKSYWQMMTPKIAQISLRFGADDIDGTVGRRKDLSRCGRTTHARVAAARPGAPDQEGWARAG